MPISINGSGTITGINAGGLPDGVIQEADLATASVTADKIATNSVTTAKLGSAEQSGLCKAFVNFNGTGTVAIRASYNVSSITDNGTGNYTVNFTTALADANYCALATTGSSTTQDVGGVRMGAGVGGTTFTTSACTFLTTGAADAVYTDLDRVFFSVFR